MSTPLDVASYMITIRRSVMALTDDQIRSGGRAAADGPANVSSSPGICFVRVSGRTLELGAVAVGLIIWRP